MHHADGVVLVKMPDGTAQSARNGFSEVLSAIPTGQRKTFVYDQEREMSRLAQLTERTGVIVYFCDPHSPWQRGLNENTNGLCCANSCSKELLTSLHVRTTRCYRMEPEYPSDKSFGLRYRFALSLCTYGTRQSRY